jgi:hypothetical protein
MSLFLCLPHPRRRLRNLKIRTKTFLVAWVVQQLSFATSTVRPHPITRTAHEENIEPGLVQQ